jgi:hypothetical protein
MYIFGAHIKRQMLVDLLLIKYLSITDDVEQRAQGADTAT